MISHLASTGHPLLAQQKIRTLRIYLGATTALYLYGVLGSLLIIRAREPLINHAGGFVAVTLGSVALIALAVTPRSQEFATLAAIIATPAVMAAHKSMTAEFVCLIAAMFLGIHLRAFFAPRRGFALIVLLLILCETAVYVAPASKMGFIDYLIIAVAIIGAAESFGFVMRALLAAMCTDALTGIQNRVGWEVSTTHLLNMYSRSPETIITVAAIDFDGLKALNDTYGHPAGDQRIREYTEFWRTTAPTASVLARLGGDEFAICIAHTNSRTVDQFLDAIRQHTPQVSIGMASNAANQANVTELYAIADTALYATRGKYLLDEPPDPSR
nr:MULTISPECIES: GGDEF domain-containing protein [unclassified Mycolicibacterium]